jgi:hypothetical protein
MQHKRKTKPLETYRGKYKFKKGYSPGINFVKDEMNDLLEYSHSNLNKRKNYFSEIFNDVRQMEIYTAGPLILEPSAS